MEGKKKKEQPEEERGESHGQIVDREERIHGGYSDGEHTHSPVHEKKISQKGNIFQRLFFIKNNIPDLSDGVDDHGFSPINKVSSKSINS